MGDTYGLAITINIKILKDMRLFSLKQRAKLLAAIAFAISSSGSYAQNVGKNPISMINPVSPTTGALLKYIDFDMNSSTGVPDITIPLLEIKGKQLSLPISISYNASGIKVNEQAGNVGLCWSLSAGGIVSRAIRGKADGGSYWPQVQNAHSDGFDPLASPGDFNLAKAISERAIDGAPDIYSYNFGSYSGKFLDIAGKTPNIVMLPKKPLDIKRTSRGTYSSFEIKAEDGTLYKFDSVETSIIKTSYSINETSYTAVLNQIISADGTDVITFEYENTQYQDFPALSESFTFLFNACTYGNEVTTGSFPDTYSNSTSQIKGRQLKRILFSEGSVEFQVSYDRLDIITGPNTRNPKINRIILKDLAGAEIKTISFTYNYYNAASSAAYAKRLRLDQVDICPQSSLCGNPLYTQSYKFTYNSTPIPFLNSFAQDHWGYYNGANSNYTLLPTYPIRLTPATCYTTNPFCICPTPVLSNSFTGANRESSADYVKAGVLEKIEYPTGGNIQFNFETNQAAPIVYATASAKNRFAQIANNTANNGTLVSASTPVSDIIPTANPTIGNSACAKVTLGYNYPAGTSPATLTQWKPYAEILNT